MNAPVNPEGVAAASNDWTGAVIRFSSHAKMTNEIQICFSKWWENEKRNSNPFFKVMRKRKTKNEIHIRFSKWCENEKRKLKLISVFQSDAKTKNEIRSSKPFFKVRRKRKTIKKQNSNLFSNVMRKRKMDMALEFPFLTPSKNGWH